MVCSYRDFHQTSIHGPSFPRTYLCAQNNILQVMNCMLDWSSSNPLNKTLCVQLSLMHFRTQPYSLCSVTFFTVPIYQQSVCVCVCVFGANPITSKCKLRRISTHASNLHEKRGNNASSQICAHAQHYARNKIR
uniref:Uncharacterized protein n=1 Tax=Oryza brachyantha TaxID=4533 RepID=J3NBF4_ORYBR